MATDKFPGVTRVKSSRIYEEVVVQIQDLVARGRLRPGEKLPPERELAERFGVGRNSVREAIRQLEMLGVVEVRQGEGTFVTEATIETIAVPFASILTHRPQLCAEVLELRKVLEPQIAALAARRARPENISRMEPLLTRFEELIDATKGPWSEALEIDSQYHYAIAEATQNGLVLRVMTAIMGLLREFREQLMEPAYRSASLSDAHQAIFEAIKAGDSKAAREAMERHMDLLDEVVAARTE